MANRFTEEDIEKIREARNLLTSKISWMEDPGGRQAEKAYMALDGFLISPAAQPKEYCSACGTELKK